MTENEMVGWHHQLDGHESEQALGVGDGQGLVSCSPWGRKDLDMTEQLNNNTLVVQWLRICLPTQGMPVQSLGPEDPLEEGHGNPLSIVAWTEEPGGLQFFRVTKSQM